MHRGNFFFLLVLFMSSFILWPPATSFSGSGGCRLGPPRVTVDLPPGLPEWTRLEVRNIAFLALNEKSLDAVWRWQNMMANPQFVNLERPEKEKLANAVLTFARIGMEERYDKSRARVRFYLQVEELLRQSDLEAQRAQLRIQYARPRSGDDDPAVSLPRVVGIPKSIPPGARPVLITQIHVMDSQAIGDYRKNIVSYRKQLAELTENAIEDTFQPEKSLDGLLSSLAQLESAIQNSLLSNEQGN